MLVPVTHELVVELTTDILTGDRTHISEDAFTEALSDYDLFWSEVVALIKARYNGTEQEQQLALSRFFGCSHAIATIVAIDASQSVAKKLINEAEDAAAAAKAEALL